MEVEMHNYHRKKKNKIEESSLPRVSGSVVYSSLIFASNLPIVIAIVYLVSDQPSILVTIAIF